MDIKKGADTPFFTFFNLKSSVSPALTIRAY